MPNFGENLSALTSYTAIRIIGGFLIPFVVLVITNTLLIKIGKPLFYLSKKILISFQFFSSSQKFRRSQLSLKDKVKFKFDFTILGIKCILAIIICLMIVAVFFITWFPNQGAGQYGGFKIIKFHVDPFQ